MNTPTTWLVLVKMVCSDVGEWWSGLKEVTKSDQIWVFKKKELCNKIEYQSVTEFLRTQTRYNAVKIREIKRIYLIDNQYFMIFLYLAILLIFACFWLNSTLLVHFEIQNFLVSLQNKKTSENKRVNDFTRFDTHLGT